jgi:hypothetical protein
MSASAGIPETSHIRAGIPAIKMAKPRKYPRICFIPKKVQHSKLIIILQTL